MEGGATGQGGDSRGASKLLSSIGEALFESEISDGCDVLSGCTLMLCLGFCSEPFWLRRIGGEDTNGEDMRRDVHWVSWFNEGSAAHESLCETRKIEIRALKSRLQWRHRPICVDSERLLDEWKRHNETRSLASSPSISTSSGFTSLSSVQGLYCLTLEVIRSVSEDTTQLLDNFIIQAQNMTQNMTIDNEAQRKWHFANLEQLVGVLRLCRQSHIDSILREISVAFTSISQATLASMLGFSADDEITRECAQVRCWKKLDSTHPRSSTGVSWVPSRQKPIATQPPSSGEAVMEKKFGCGALLDMRVGELLRKPQMLSPVDSTQRKTPNRQRKNR